MILKNKIKTKVNLFFMLCWKWKHGKGSHRVGVNIQSLIQNKVYRDNYKPIQNYKSIRKVELACK